MSLHINPKIITWARERNGMTVEELAQRMKKTPDDVRKWESGQAKLSNAALEALAYKHFKIPLALFYFPEPPSLDDPKKAFRRLPEFELERFSPNTLQTVRVAQAYQDSLVELAPESAERRKIFRNLKLTTNNVKSIASDARHYLGVSLSRQFEFASAETAFKVWRHALEGAGIFTFKDALRDKFISGFSLQHDSYPIIFVNNSNAHERQVFTLFHELGHLLFGISGVTDVNETYINFMSSNERLVEIKCNEFAGEVLLPDQAFRHDVSRLDRARIETVIPKLARKYSVSSRGYSNEDSFNLAS